MLSHFEEKKVLCSGAAYVNGGVNAFMQIICTYIMGLYTYYARRVCFCNECLKTRPTELCHNVEWPLLDDTVGFKQLTIPNCV